MSKWIPYPAYAESFPFDIRFAFGNEAPAGKHGFLTVQGDKFVFEDGTEARFWGANFNSALCFPTHEYTEQVANRVASAGVNIVRLHQMDADWSTPNIFQFKKGQRLVTTGVADPESLDRMDYLIKCLKENGVYIYMDILTYRRFRTSECKSGAERLTSGAKIYSYTNPEIIELQKKLGWIFEDKYETYKDKWEDIVKTLSEAPSEEEVLCMLTSVGLPLDDFYKTYSEEKLADAVRYAKDLKDRYTVLWLLNY